MANDQDVGAAQFVCKSGASPAPTCPAGTAPDGNGPPPTQHRSRPQAAAGPQSPLIAFSPPASTRALAMPPAILTALQETCDGVRADVKHALEQLDALRTAQTKTAKRITDLESVIGTHGKRRRADAQVEDTQPRTLVQGVVSIQAAIDQLVAASVGSSSTRSDGTTSPDLARELGTLSFSRTEYVDASVQACLLSTPDPSRSRSRSDVGVATDEQCENDPAACTRHPANSAANDRPSTLITDQMHADDCDHPLPTASHTESTPVPFFLLSSAPAGDVDAPAPPLQVSHTMSRHVSVMPDSSLSPMSDEDRRVDDRMQLRTPDMISRDASAMAYSPPTTPTSKEDRAVRVHGESEGEDVDRMSRVASREKEVVHGGPNEEADDLSGLDLGVVDGGETLALCLRYPSPGPGGSLFGDDVCDDEARPTAVTDERQLPEHPIGDPTLSQLDGTLSIFSSLHHDSSPSSSPHSRQTQDETEVLDALLVRPMSTPPWSRAVSPPRTSPAPVRASTSYQRQHVDVDAVPGTPPQLFTVNPSVLHVRIEQSPTYSTRSLTPLTPLDDTSSDEEDLGMQRGESARANVENRSVPSAGASAEKDSSASSGRAVGGPGATLDELMRLSRREPLKIRLKVPEKAPELKRKRDVREEEANGGSWWIEAATAWNAISASAQDASEIEPPAMGEDDGSERLVRKKTKRQEPGKPFRTSEGSARKKKVQRPADPAVRSPLRYHVRKGQLVSVEPEPQDASPDTARTLKSAVRAAGGAKAVLMPPRVPQRVQAPLPLSSPPTNKVGPTLRERSAMSSPVKTPKSRRGATWPKRLLVFSHWDTQFVQCDDCDRWYHYGCVGITSGDPRLELGSAFICPKCHVSGTPKRPVSDRDGTCARPGCTEPQATEADAEHYFVEKLIGRKKAHGCVYLWLAKWEGYPLSEATWIPKENVVGDGTKLFNAFVEEAVEEGADLAREMVLLKEAVDAGWDTR